MAIRHSVIIKFKQNDETTFLFNRVISTLKYDAC